jgi:hypothetical protein
MNCQQRRPFYSFLANPWATDLTSMPRIIANEQDKQETGMSGNRRRREAAFCCRFACSRRTDARCAMMPRVRPRPAGINLEQRPGPDSGGFSDGAGREPHSRSPEDQHYGCSLVWSVPMTERLKTSLDRFNSTVYWEPRSRSALGCPNGRAAFSHDFPARDSAAGPRSTLCHWRRWKD